MIKIGLPDQNDFITEVHLDGQTYFLHFGWNSEWQQWEFGVENARNERLVAGIPVTPFSDLLGAYRRLPVPQGAFMALPVGNAEIDRQSFVNGLTNFIYLTAEELSSANGNAVRALLRH